MSSIAFLTPILADAMSDEQARQAAAAGGIMAAIAGMMVVILIVAVVFYLIMAFSIKKILEKAGQPGWPGFVPVYNMWRLFEISGKPGALSLIILAAPIPIIGGLAALGVQIYLGICVGKAFNKSTGFVVGLILLGIVFYPILAFGDSTYQPGAAAAQPGFPVGPPQQ